MLTDQLAGALTGISFAMVKMNVSNRSENRLRSPARRTGTGFTP
jgi:hypothetical protein